MSMVSTNLHREVGGMTLGKQSKGLKAQGMMSSDGHMEDGNWLELKKWKGSCYAHRAVHGTTTNLVQTLGPDGTKEEVRQVRDESGSLDYHRTIKQSNACRECPVPVYVMCMLTVTVQKTAEKSNPTLSKTFIYGKPVQFPWLWTVAYKNIRQIMDAFVRKRDPDTKRFYLGTSRVRLMAWNSTEFGEIDSRIVETEQHWERQIPRMVAQYCGRNHDQNAFYLEINSDFEWFMVQPFGYNQPLRYKQSIQSALKETKSTNHDGKEYWAKKVLKELFDRKTIHGIVNDFYDKRKEKSISLPLEERTDFVEWLWNDHVRLLAITIQSNTKLDRLQKLMQLERNHPGEDAYIIKDEKIPLSDTDMDLFLELGEITAFRAVQGGFKPVNFPQPGTWKHQVIQDNQIVPIYYDDKSLLGHGGSGGSVYKATIHPDYHAYSTNKNDTFALKILSNSVRNHAQEEMKAWQYVADQPHNHITTFYTSWSQSGKFYMLSPRADKSLRDFLFDKKTASSENDTDTEWLLEQLEGLASGVQHIHHIGRAGLGTQDSSGRKIDCGYHHDLKPDNVLVFGGRVWKISDFGAAKIRQVVSSSATVPRFYTRNLPRGDEEYGSPEYLVSKIGRSYDIWSLGCIFLEVLLWAFGQGDKHLEEFRIDRSKETRGHCNEARVSPQGDDTAPDQYTDFGDTIVSDPMPNFWFRCEKCERNYLKKCVTAKLEWVKSQAEKQRRLLSPLCELVEKMLAIDPTKRPPASAVSDQIGTLRVRAKVYFGHQRRVAQESGGDTQLSDDHAESIMSALEVDTRTYVQSLESRSRDNSSERRKAKDKDDRARSDKFDQSTVNSFDRGRRKRPRSPTDTTRDISPYSRDVRGVGRHADELSGAATSPDIHTSTGQLNKRRNTATNAARQTADAISKSDPAPRLSARPPHNRTASRSRPRTLIGPSGSSSNNNDEDNQAFPGVDTQSSPANDPVWINQITELEDDAKPYK